MEDMRLQEQENQKPLDGKATNVDVDGEYDKPNTAEPREETSILRSEETPTKTEATPSNTEGTISSTSSEPLDNSSSIFNNCDLEDGTLLEESEDKESKSDDKEEEGTYEELICLVRQFYVEKPINPAALAHQNIETC